MSTPNEIKAAAEPGQAAWLDPRRARWLLVGILALAFLVRLIYVLQMRANPYFDAPVMDPLYHVDWARAVAAGETFQEGPFFRAPLYPWFLGLVFKLFGDGLLLPRILQCLFGTLATLLVYLIGRDAFDRRTGLLASLGAATYWVLVYFDGELLIPSLAIPLNLLALWLTLKLGDRPSWRWSFGAGCAWGLAAIARPNVLLLMPVLFAWLLWRFWSERRDALMAAGALTLGTLVPILPLTAHNVAQGDFSLIATQAGVNLWIGNNPTYAEAGVVSTAIVPGTRQGWWEGFYDAIAQANAAEGRELKPSEVSAYYSAKAWSWVFSNPGDALQHWLLKLRMFWNRNELGNNQPIRGFAERFGPITNFLPLGFSVVAPLGLLGLALVLLRGAAARTRLLPLWAFLIVYTLSVVAFFINGRFRLPIIPVLLVFGAHAFLWLISELRAREVAKLTPAALFVAAAAAFTFWTPSEYEDRGGALTLNQLGIAAMQAGDTAGALEYFDAALSARPTFTEAHTARGIALRLLGRPNEAEQAFLAALDQKGDDREALAAYADLLMTSAARLPEAARVAGILVQQHPSFALGFYHLGRALGQSADPAGAEKAFRDGLALDPGESDAEAKLALGLGTALAMQQEFAEAADVYLRAYNAALSAGWSQSSEEEEQTAYWRVALQLYQTLHLSGRSEDGDRFADELGVRHPEDQRVQEIRRNRPR